MKIEYSYHVWLTCGCDMYIAEKWWDEIKDYKLECPTDEDHGNRIIAYYLKVADTRIIADALRDFALLIDASTNPPSDKIEWVGTLEAARDWLYGRIH